jgi:hypothetical protein
MRVAAITGTRQAQPIERETPTPKETWQWSKSA